MQEIEFTVPPKFDFAQAEGCIEGVCARHGIEVAMQMYPREASAATSVFQ